MLYIRHRKTKFKTIQSYRDTIKNDINTMKIAKNEQNQFTKKLANLPVILNLEAPPW